MRRPVVFIAVILGVAGLGAAAYYWHYVRRAGVGEEAKAPTVETAPDPALFPLKLPPGFTFSIFARHVPGARVLALDPKGTLLVSLTSQGRVVALPDKNDSGAADALVTVLEGLNQPHGLAFGPGDQPRLYVAETDQVAAYDYDPERLLASRKETIADLPPGGLHSTRSLVFLPGPRDRRLLIAVGSSCDACEENDPHRTRILAVEPEGGVPSVYASGLRYPAFMAVHPLSKLVWATETGREGLGQDWPPDEINIILEKSLYGWPYCYGKRIHDDKSDPTGAHQKFCQDTMPSFIDVPAQAEPLGLFFFPREWPKEFGRDLLVAFHGSLPRAAPAGCKVVRYHLDAAGNVEHVEDFITGWLTPKGPLGRPVDVLITTERLIYISDDQAGVVYRVAYRN